MASLPGRIVSNQRANGALNVCAAADAIVGNGSVGTARFAKGFSAALKLYDARDSLPAPAPATGSSLLLPQRCARNQRREPRDFRDEPDALELHNNTRELNIQNNNNAGCSALRSQNTAQQWHFLPPTVRSRPRQAPDRCAARHQSIRAYSRFLDFQTSPGFRPLRQCRRCATRWCGRTSCERH
jgi:hypothetical protein